MIHTYIPCLPDAGGVGGGVGVGGSASATVTVVAVEACIVESRSQHGPQPAKTALRGKFFKIPFWLEIC